MAARTKQRFAPDFMIMQRRKEEDMRQVYEEKTKSDNALQKYLTFQHTTDARIDRNKTIVQTESMRRQIEEDLNTRRAKLAAMLEEEERQYTAELKALEETPDMRRDRLKARARELIRRREQEKREFAILMRERQFREGCDAFREHDSMLLLQDCVEARGRAVEEKEAARRAEREEQAMWHQQLLELVRKAEAREAADKSRDAELRSQMLRALDSQMRELQARREEDARLKEEEARLMRERFELDLQEARRAEEERARMFNEKKVAVARHNAQVRAEREAAIRRQQEEDLELLNAMLEKERAAEEAEQAYKVQLRQQAREYQAQLVELMKKEAVDEAASEAIRQAEQERAWRKREEVWERDRAMREKLMAEVVAARREQLEERLEQNRREREHALSERERMMADVEEMHAKDVLQAQIRKHIAKEHQRELLLQIEEARSRMRREMDLAALELEASRREEEAYQARLQREMLTRRPAKNHGLKSTGLF